MCYVRIFTYIIFNLHKKHTHSRNVHFEFCEWGNWSSERLHDFIQPAIRDRIHIQFVWFLSQFQCSVCFFLFPYCSVELVDYTGIEIHKYHSMYLSLTSELHLSPLLNKTKQGQIRERGGREEETPHVCRGDVTGWGFVYFFFPWSPSPSGITGEIKNEWSQRKRKMRKRQGKNEMNKSRITN